ncbi:sensor domain-containing phosphodiesterase [Frankia nepalensis]|uniref:sensor domain-containing phosphodiesterase n=1 Tax=Frankia nepalensis TaxID=1836974 RepID=UPI0027DD27AE|nr:EAL domain-containing protein [Frankia nepalensis]
MAEDQACLHAEWGSRGALLDPDEAVSWLLSLARRHLRMDLSWLSRFTPDLQIIEALHGDAASFRLSPGTATSFCESYCARVLDGRLPPVIPNARTDERTAPLPITDEFGIGAYVGAPVVLDDGRVYGMLCCLNHEADPRLGTRDARFLTLLAEVLAQFVSRLTHEREDRDLLVRRISMVIRNGLTMQFQPVVDVPTLRVVGAEALARFPPGSGGPEAWFAAAASVGLRTELELAAISRAFAAFPRLPAQVWLAVNASPTVVASGRLRDVLAEAPATRVVVEVTEHEGIQDYPAVCAALDDLRGRDTRIAVDDVGVANAELNRLLRLSPDILKMDRELTWRIDKDPARRALAGALVQFAGEIGARVLAEGVETADEFATLADIGVHEAQGFYLGRPGPLPLPERCAAGERSLTDVSR